MTGIEKPVFSGKAFLFEDDVEISHIDHPASTFKGEVMAGTWAVILSNGLKAMPMALNVPDEDLANRLASAKAAYQEHLVSEGVFTGTDDVLIQDPEGNQILTYTGFEK